MLCIDEALVREPKNRHLTFFWHSILLCLIIEILHLFFFEFIGLDLTIRPIFTNPKNDLLAVWPATHLTVFLFSLHHLFIFIHYFVLLNCLSFNFAVHPYKPSRYAVVRLRSTQINEHRARKQ